MSSLPGRSRLPSVVGLMEQHELTARCRVDGLCEEADASRLAELAAAEQKWQEWAIIRGRVDTVLTPDDGITAEAEVTEDPRDTDPLSGPRMWRSQSHRCRCGARASSQSGRITGLTVHVSQPPNAGPDWTVSRRVWGRPGEPLLEQVCAR
ncbi:hypothetical protein GCM10022403_022920 [Streptomyces coacervatus]|uniref:Uncharacterized protein n=1 Tax=Streptomyces coacervatus TaxID=647381 RepID=A0ABP7H9Q3_9ACTN